MKTCLVECLDNGWPFKDHSTEAGGLARMVTYKVALALPLSARISPPLGSRIIGGNVVGHTSSQDEAVSKLFSFPLQPV